MNKIDLQLQKIKKEKRFGIMTHVVVGYPSLPKTFSLIKSMEKAGVDFVELQIPFSDPLADGPTIMKASEASLKNGTKVKDAFAIAQKVSMQTSIPLLFMAYFNTVFKYGVKKFCEDAQRAGITGLIVPDFSLEEESNDFLQKYCEKNNLYLIRVISPSSTTERLQKNAKRAQGFVYCAARQGTTDAKKNLDPRIALYLETVKKEFSIPLAVGFGISSRERLKIIEPYSNIAVIGSAILDVINGSPSELIEKNVEDFLKNMIQRS